MLCASAYFGEKYLKTFGKCQYEYATGDQYAAYDWRPGDDFVENHYFPKECQNDVKGTGDGDGGGILVLQCHSEKVLLTYAH